MAHGILCDNPDCRWHFEHRGGVFELREKQMLCEDCINTRRMGPVIGTTCKNLWDFETTHFNGEKMHVQSLPHLRQLEKQYGCSNHTANFYEKDWSTPPPVRQRPLHPRLVDVLGRRYSEG